MYQFDSTYNLYCVNMGCADSIFGRIKDTQFPITIDNLISTHHCTACSHVLVSSMEIELEQMLSSAGVKSPDKSDYTSY
ncbi:MAG TPA: hypothetical protein VK671_17700 [Mucilaginibacter sp.]|jgi:hypothetical protein|nr:hypothetical protein [Mucilaginibacter sp.]